MTSPSTSSPSKTTFAAGFSLIEVILILAIIAFISVFGVIVGTDSFLRQNRRAEVDSVTGLLEKARSLAINNIETSAYGVHFADPDYLILFQGTTYSGPYVYRSPKNAVTPYDLSGCLAGEVYFEQLSGRSLGCQVVVDNKIVTINNEGGINY